MEGASPFLISGCSADNKKEAPMPRDPREVWQYFAQALIQEEDPEKIRFLTEKLFEALAETEEKKKLNLPRSKSTPSE